MQYVFDSRPKEGAQAGLYGCRNLPLCVTNILITFIIHKSLYSECHMCWSDQGSNKIVYIVTYYSYVPWTI